VLAAESKAINTALAKTQPPPPPPKKRRKRKNLQNDASGLYLFMKIM
jgi:hypothetical protein